MRQLLADWTAAVEAFLSFEDAAVCDASCVIGNPVYDELGDDES
jgi:hypothetical protein